MRLGPLLVNIQSLVLGRSLTAKDDDAGHNNGNRDDSSLRYRDGTLLAAGSTS